MTMITVTIYYKNNKKVTKSFANKAMANDFISREIPQPVKIRIIETPEIELWLVNEPSSIVFEFDKYPRIYGKGLSMGINND